MNSRVSGHNLYTICGSNVFVYTYNLSLEVGQGKFNKDVTELYQTFLPMFICASTAFCIISVAGISSGRGVSSVGS